ncbi:hypothetical protein SBV45_03145 [Chlamydia crocodili]
MVKERLTTQIEMKQLKDNEIDIKRELIALEADFKMFIKENDILHA